MILIMIGFIFRARCTITIHYMPYTSLSAYTFPRAAPRLTEHFHDECDNKLRQEACLHGRVPIPRTAEMPIRLGPVSGAAMSAMPTADACLIYFSKAAMISDATATARRRPAARIPPGGDSRLSADEEAPPPRGGEAGPRPPGAFPRILRRRAEAAGLRAVGHHARAAKYANTAPFPTTPCTAGQRTRAQHRRSARAQQATTKDARLPIISGLITMILCSRLATSR